MKSILIISFLLLVGLSGFGQEKDTTQWNYYRGKIKDITFFINLNPKDDQKIFTRATYKEKIENYQGVVDDLSKCIELKPKNPDYYYYRAYYKELLYKDNNHSDEIIADYSSAIIIDSTHKTSINNRGLVYFEADSVDLARKDFEKLIALYPNWATSSSNMARYYSFIGNKDEAIKYYKQAIELEPSLAVPYNNLGKIYTEKKEYVLALDYYNKAYEKNKYYTNALRNRADLKILMKDKEGACRDLKMAADLGDNKAKAHYKNDCDFVNEFDQPYNQNKIIEETLPQGTMIFVTVDKKPLLNGTTEGLNNYLRDEIKYPLIGVNLNALVLVRFHIDKKGKVYDVKILKGAHELIDKEVLRVFKEMPKWSPAEHEGKKVNVQHTIPIKLSPNK